jgi:hypothetical protein
MSMNTRVSVALTLIIPLVLLSCIGEDFFGQSDFKQILYFSVPQQSGPARIDQDSLIVRLTVSASARLDALYADSVQLSTFATVFPQVGDVRDFGQPVPYTVSAENGTTATYTVYVDRESETPQLENSGFDDWHTPAGKNYQEPGVGPSAIWATGNAGVVTLGTANATPISLGPGDNAAQLITRDLGTLAQLVGQRMAAGTIFTGRFELNIADPLKSTIFGTPFVARPKSFSIRYTYVPGLEYCSKNGQILDKQDSCDIYLLLENRQGNTVRRLATGWLRSGEKVEDFRDVTVELVYGNLPAGSPSYLLPAGGDFGTASDPVTHLVFVASSSANGALFEGGVNSTLVLDDLRLNY